MTALALGYQAAHRTAFSLPLRIRGAVFTVAVLALNIAHPILHGTPLDGGALDALLGYLNNQVATDSGIESLEGRRA